MTRGSLHVHTTYCDGKSTVEENILAAIEKKFTYLGFSGHGYTNFDESYCMSKEGEAQYFEEIGFLAEKYKNEIKILRGVEHDGLSSYDAHPYDYKIASVHYIRAQGEICEVDRSWALQEEAIKNFFGGDPYAYAEEYYRTVASQTGDIVGHFDLVTKYDKGNKIFTPKEVRYKKAVLSALEILLDKNMVFEVNTGSMARGYKDRPYPDMWILEELKKRGGKVVITSDCHRAENLDFGYEETEKLLSKIGFTDFYNIDFIK